jgi:hypothetical protein
MSSAGTVLLNLDKTHNVEVNLAALKRIDPDTVDIAASSNHCAVYQHDSETDTWVRRVSWLLRFCPPPAPLPPSPLPGNRTHPCSPHIL